jgi:hypothetical protein
MDHDLSERRRLEKELMLAVKRAADEFSEAKREHQRLLGISGELGLAHPDGQVALTRAMAIYNDKFQKYRQALRALTELTVRGNNPRE